MGGDRTPTTIPPGPCNKEEIFSMAHITLDSRGINRSLVRLLKRLADAIGWVCQPRRKITLDVPDPVREIIVPLGLTPGACGKPIYRPPFPDARPDVEILLAVLKKLEKEVSKRSKTTRKTKRPK
jgi:hypothetical protein